MRVDALRVFDEPQHGGSGERGCHRHAQHGAAPADGFSRQAQGRGGQQIARGSYAKQPRAQQRKALRRMHPAKYIDGAHVDRAAASPDQQHGDVDVKRCPGGGKDHSTNDRQKHLRGNRAARAQGIEGPADGKLRQDETGDPQGLEIAQRLRIEIEFEPQLRCDDRQKRAVELAQHIGGEECEKDAHTSSSQGAGCGASLLGRFNRN